MDFSHSRKSLDYQDRLNAFMADHVYPAEAAAEQQRSQVGPERPPVLDALKDAAKEQHLWNLSVLSS